jgi:PAS domain S-box-containing protein
MNSTSAVPFDPPEHPAPLLDRTLVAAFLEHVPDIVFFKDDASRFIAVSRSKARRHGRNPQDLLGRTDADYFVPEHAQAARTDEARIMATGQPVLARLEHTRFNDGREGWTEVSKLPLRDDSGAIVGTFGLCTDVTETQRIKLELDQAHRELLSASRLAGMAEVATGVLHNVGNVLTSVNVSANVLAAGLQQNRAESLERVADLLQEHAADLDTYLTTDAKGRVVPDFLASLGQHWLEERDRLLQELASLQQSIDHIKEIVAMQQAYATASGRVEALDPVALMEDALRMNAGALERHHVTWVRDFLPTPPMRAEKAKVLQILINLIRNAKYAAAEGGQPGPAVTLGVAPGTPGRVRLIVADNGVGIAARNLDRIFTHGFTTRPDGHGFGLHSSLAAARAMQGDLTAQSPGPGQGATFTLDLPAA